MKIIKSCRNCKNTKLDKLFSLGNLSFTGKFTKKKNAKIPKDYINLIKCKKCHLVQLDRSFNSNYLYGLDYGYRSGINLTMTSHLKSISKKLSNLTKLKKDDFVLDIASNDATLLNSYKILGVKKVGVDPILKKFKKFYKRIDFKISKFFSKKIIQEAKIKKKFKIITACAVFYDIENPNKFLKDISDLIDKKNGIFYLEFQDLLSIIKNDLFDTICHEHLEYYSFKVINNMLKFNNLKLIDVSKNDINGGSLALVISHKLSNYKINYKKINNLVSEEKKYKLELLSTYNNFFQKIQKLKENLNILLFKLVSNNKTIHGYGASTKGNVLLQYFNINNKIISLIADRNPEKNNLFTPGTNIKIVNEKKSRRILPDFYLVLPWHFKKEILLREKKIRQKGTKFIFPLPKLEVK
jgi:hypothetical protein